MSGSLYTGLTLKLLWHVKGRKDYDFTDANIGLGQTLADYEEMEALSETFSPGRKGIVAGDEKVL